MSHWPSKRRLLTELAHNSSGVAAQVIRQIAACHAMNARHPVVQSAVISIDVLDVKRPLANPPCVQAVPEPPDGLAYRQPGAAHLAQIAGRSYGQSWHFNKASNAIDPQDCFGHELQTDGVEVACEAVIGLGGEKVGVGYGGDL